jgi:hypothetical protein
LITDPGRHGNRTNHYNRTADEHQDIASTDNCHVGAAHHDVPTANDNVAAVDGLGWLLGHVCVDRPVGHRQRRLPG